MFAAGEFLGSLVQIEEGLRKLNINEEVSWWLVTDQLAVSGVDISHYGYHRAV
jgi:hypothetical protein